MGQFKIEIHGVGDHGAQRDVPNGGSVNHEHSYVASVDHAAAEAVRALQKRGASIEHAKLIHWPGQEAQVVDDLLSHIRHGNF